MAFSFGSPSAAGAPAGINAQNGPDLEDIQTEGLGFSALSGESKVQLLPTPWPADQLPPPTASLMSIASNKGLVAAAGPDAVIVARTESVRKAFEGPVSGDGNTKPFTPELKIDMPMRISQLTFSSDESYLILSAEQGGGLAVYDVQGLLQGLKDPKFQISTNGQALRALIPNPTQGELVSLVTNDGKLMMVNLKDQNFVSGPNGQVLKEGVSCISWSARGKQLVAGLIDGTAYQMTPDGQGKAEIPRPPNVSASDHVSSITWLENHVFLVVHTPSNYDNSQAPSSSFHIVTREQANQSNFMFQKISDPAGPFGLNRSPPHHFLLRLREFPPNLQDLLVIASTASADIGIFTRSKVPLSAGKPAEKITGVFTMTEMLDDSRRAALPMSADLNDTSPIGLAFDLSSKDKVFKPLPAEEINESPSPVPALMVLNNDGVLAAWWVIYTESIRQGTTFPGLAIAGGTQAPQQTPASNTAPKSTFGAPAQPAFGQSTFGSSASNTPAFGKPQATTAFGTPSLQGPSTSAFGAASGLGKGSSPWGTPATSAGTTSNTPAFGSSAFGSSANTQPKPAFGASTFGSTPAPTAPAFGSSTFGAKPSGPAFGSSTFGSTPSAPATSAFGQPAFGATSTPALGNRASPWGSGSTATTSTFGQAGLSKDTPVFGSSNTGSAAPAASGFASFASKGGFSNAAAPSGSGTSNLFGSQATPNPLFAPAANKAASPFGSASTTDNKPFGSGGFVLGSTFKADPSAKDDAPDRSSASGGSLFGGAFGSALGEAAKSPPAQPAVSNDADMDAEEVPKTAATKLESTTPSSTPAAPPKSQMFTSPPSAGLFGTPTSTSTVPPKPASTGFNFGPAAVDKPKPAGFSFANLGANTSPPPKTPLPSDTPSSASLAKTPPSPKIKQEPAPDTPAISGKIPEAPLPPDPTNFAPPKSVPAPAPSPPSPPPKQAFDANLIPPSDVPGGPEDEGNDDSDFLTEEEDEGESESEGRSEEGSGEDVTKDLSPVSENNQTPGFTPQSSFGGLKNRSPESMFTKINKPSQPAQSRPLFGELNTSAPVLPPPRVQASPRSPSPIRGVIPGRMQRPDASRSSSAPGFASQLLESQRGAARPPIAVQNTFALSVEEQKQEQRRREDARARKEAEETQALQDEDDAKVQEFLASEVTPTLVLGEFQAHSNYDIKNSADSIPAQVEAVYRDINAMIDTLGLNARSLKSFVAGHTEKYKEEGRTREDLEDEDEDWCLVEVENLSSLLEKDLARELEDARVKDVAEKLETCNDLQKDVIRLRARHEDIKKIIDIRRDPDQLALARVQPLTAEQAGQQSELRKGYTDFQKLLAEAEESLSVLKARIVSQATSNGRANGSAGPTVEAVMRTITKMTSMAEKRSGDIDVLENQMRRLRFGSTMSAGSREGSPFTTPQNNRTSMRPSASSTFGSFYTPDSIKDGPHRFQNSFMSSIGSRGGSSPPRKKLSGYSPGEKLTLRNRLEEKKAVKEKLKEALRKAGTNVRLMDDDE